LQAFLEKEDLWSKSSVTIIDEKSKFHTDFRNKIESKQNLEHTLFKGQKSQIWKYCSMNGIIALKENTYLPSVAKSSSWMPLWVIYNVFIKMTLL
jgi:hypothetical protein